MQSPEKVISNCNKSLHNFLVLPSLSTPLVKSADFSSCFLPFYACFHTPMSQANVRCHVFIIVIYYHIELILLVAAELSLQKKENHTPCTWQPHTFCVTLIHLMFKDSQNKGSFIHYSARGSLTTNFPWYLFSNQDPENRHTWLLLRSVT